MAKAKQETANTEEEATPQENKPDERFKMITHPETGERVKRKDYILDLWRGGKMTRGEIAKHLTELAQKEHGDDAKKVPYQIVFAATRGIPGGPVKESGDSNKESEAAE